MLMVEGLKAPQGTDGMVVLHRYTGRHHERIQPVRGASHADGCLSG